jgi:hypothetical protein
MTDPLENKWVSVTLALALLLGFSAIVTLSWVLGAPKQLPAVALGSPVVLHLLRAALITALIGAVALVLARGAFGHWPMEAGGVKYSAPAVEDWTQIEEVLHRMRLVLVNHDEWLKELDQHDAHNADRIEELEARSIEWGGEYEE